MPASFRVNTVATVRFSPVDQTGLPLTVESAQYRVTDQDGIERVAMTAVDEAGIVDTEVVVTIAADVNDLAPGVVRGLRTVTIEVTTLDGVFTFSDHYLVESDSPLVVMVNSFQTLPQAILRGSEITNVDMWDAASDDRKIRALTDAFRNITKLSFHGAYSDSQSRITEKVWFPSKLTDLTESQFLALDASFIKALCVAQVVEADALLGGTDVSNLRVSGLMSASVGEVSQMFRPSTPLQLPVSRRAIQALAGYVRWSMGVSR